MIIDCDCCAMQHTATCEDCVVTFILGGEPGSLALSAGEASALDHLAEAGLVPPLRLLPRREPFDRRAS